ncbi:MAG: DNA alkylation repair protein [Vicinamibacterales bacterium]
MARAARLSTPPPPARSRARIASDARTALTWLERRGTRRNRDGMARYGITAAKAFGVSMATMQTLARRLGRDHDLARALWRSGWHEARILAALVGEPDRLTPAEMDAWCRDFDNWAVCDTVCLHLFDKSPLAWRKVRAWARRRGEFEKRAAFALLAGLALHDRRAREARFHAVWPLIERAATDPRHYVRKGVSWALRAIGHRSLALHGAAVDLATRFARAEDPSTRWIGRDALRDLTRPAVRTRVGARPLS